MKFEMITDAESDDQIINLADSLSLSRWGERMDSLDLGDSMGVFIRAAIEDLYNGELVNLYCGEGIQVEMKLEMDLFDWNR